MAKAATPTAPGIDPATIAASLEAALLNWLLANAPKIASDIAKAITPTTATEPAATPSQIDAAIDAVTEAEKNEGMPPI